MEFIQVLTTVDSREAALRIAKASVSKRAAACGQVLGPITSTYWWKGVIEESEEWQCLLKTAADMYGELEAVIRSEHPYDVPEIIATAITQGNPAYLDWCAAEVTHQK